MIMFTQNLHLNVRLSRYSFRKRGNISLYISNWKITLVYARHRPTMEKDAAAIKSVCVCWGGGPFLNYIDEHSSSLYIFCLLDLYLFSAVAISCSEIRGHRDQTLFFFY